MANDVLLHLLTTVNVRLELVALGLEAGDQDQGTRGKNAKTHDAEGNADDRAKVETVRAVAAAAARDDEQLRRHGAEDLRRLAVLVELGRAVLLQQELTDRSLGLRTAVGGVDRAHAVPIEQQAVLQHGVRGGGGRRSARRLVRRRLGAIDRCRDRRPGDRDAVRVGVNLTAHRRRGAYNHKVRDASLEQDLGLGGSVRADRLPVENIGDTTESRGASALTS